MIKYHVFTDYNKTSYRLHTSMWTISIKKLMLLGIDKPKINTQKMHTRNVNTESKTYRNHGARCDSKWARQKFGVQWYENNGRSVCISAYASSESSLSDRHCNRRRSNQTRAVHSWRGWRLLTRLQLALGNPHISGKRYEKKTQTRWYLAILSKSKPVSISLLECHHQRFKIQPTDAVGLWTISSRDTNQQIVENKTSKTEQDVRIYATD